MIVNSPGVIDVGNTVNKIPSIGLPLTTETGHIHPAWYAFFRSFIAQTVEDTETTTTAAVTVTAGAGLTGGGQISDDITLNVGAGNGIAVNANDVAVDISGQSNVQAEPDDEVMIVDVSDNSSIRKTKVRDITALSSPGGSNTQVQYNNTGIFGGDANFVTDGSGSVDITGDLDVDNINLNTNTISTTNTNGSLTLSPNGTGEIAVDGHINLTNNDHIYWAGGSVTGYGIGGEGGTPYIQGSSSNYKFLTLTSGFNLAFGASMSVDFRDTIPGVRINGDVGLYRTVTSGITASTTQTQGQQPLVRDINEVSTVANANDTVTLPTAIIGRHCLVINNGANTLQVFPASGDNLGAGVDTSTTVTAGSRKLFIAYDTTNWEPVI